MSVSIGVGVVKILKGDRELLNNWMEFTDHLGVDAETHADLERRLNSGNLKMYGLLKEAICHWISQNGSEATVSKLGVILAEMGAKDCNEKLQASFCPLSQITFGTSKGDVSFQIKHPFRFGVGRQVHDYTGRRRELDQLTKLLESELQVVVIGGLGGMGKTELTKKFISGLPLDVVVIWVFGETADTLRSSLVKLCDSLQLTTTENNKPIPSTQLVNSAIDKFLRNCKSFRLIFVLDNVDETYPDLFQVTRAVIVHSESRVIITSRRKDILPGESGWVELMEMDHRDAIDLVTATLGPSVKEEDAKALCQRLQNFPLALQQAIAYIKQQRRLVGQYDILCYLTEFEKRFKVAVGLKLNLVGYEETTLTVWALTMNKIKKDMGPSGRLAYSVLDVLAFVNPDGIQVNFINTLVSLATGRPSTDNEVEEALMILSLFSMVRLDRLTISLHRLVQKVTRLRMEKHAPRTTDFLLGILGGLEIVKLATGEIPHMLSIWDHYSQQTRTTNTHIPIQILNRSLLLSIFNEINGVVELNTDLLQLTLGIGDEYTPPRIHAEKMYMYNDVLQWQRRELGQRYARTLSPHEARMQLESDHRTQVAELGEEHVNTLRTKRLLGVTLVHLGERVEGVTMLQQVLEGQKRILGEDHTHTIDTMGFLFKFQLSLPSP